MGYFIHQNSEFSYPPIYQYFPAQIIQQIFRSCFIIILATLFLSCWSFFRQSYPYISPQTTGMIKIGQDKCIVHDLLSFKRNSWTSTLQNREVKPIDIFFEISSVRAFEVRGPFLESSETFRTYFGLHNSLCIFKTKAFRGTKPCIYFNFYSLYNI